MDGHRLRPTFTIPLEPDPDEAMAVIRRRLEGTAYRECSRSKGRCADFFVNQAERRIWSPYLSVQVEPAGAGSLLRGRFGPHPELWTLYMFLYTATGFMAVMGLILAFVQWQSGMDPWGLWGVGVGVPGMLSLYLVSRTGQKLSAHQMDGLRRRVSHLVEGMESSRPF
jgi:hypothetical protein